MSRGPVPAGTSTGRFTAVRGAGAPDAQSWVVVRSQRFSSTGRRMSVMGWSRWCDRYTVIQIPSAVQWAAVPAGRCGPGGFTGWPGTAALLAPVGVEWTRHTAGEPYQPDPSDRAWCAETRSRPPGRTSSCLPPADQRLGVTRGSCPTAASDLGRSRMERRAVPASGVRNCAKPSLLQAAIALASPRRTSGRTLVVNSDVHARVSSSVGVHAFTVTCSSTRPRSRSLRLAFEQSTGWASMSVRLIGEV